MDFGYSPSQADSNSRAARAGYKKLVAECTERIREYLKYADQSDPNFIALQRVTGAWDCSGTDLLEADQTLKRRGGAGIGEVYLAQQRAIIELAFLDQQYPEKAELRLDPVEVFKEAFLEADPVSEIPLRIINGAIDSDEPILSGAIYQKCRDLLGPYQISTEKTIGELASKVRRLRAEALRREKEAAEAGEIKCPQ